MNGQISGDVFILIFMRNGLILWWQKMGAVNGKQRKKKRKGSKKGKTTTSSIILLCYAKNAAITVIVFQDKLF